MTAMGLNHASGFDAQPRSLRLNRFLINALPTYFSISGDRYGVRRLSEGERRAFLPER
jgi:hypothetical protein